MDLILPMYTKYTTYFFVSSHIKHFVFPMLLYNTVGNKYFQDQILILS